MIKIHAFADYLYLFRLKKNCRAVIFPAVLSSMPSGDPCCGDAKKRLEKCNISIGQIDLMLMTNHAYWFFSHIYSRTRQIKTIKIIWVCNYNFLVAIGNLSLFHISMKIWCNDFILKISVCCKAIPNFKLIYNSMYRCKHTQNALCKEQKKLWLCSFER